MRTYFDFIQAMGSWFFRRGEAIFTGGKDIDTGGGDVIVGAGSVDGVDLTVHVADVDAHHNESHTVASHSDTTGTGSELDDLTDGSDVTLHTHDTRYFQESEFSDNPGANSKPLESDSSGFLELEGLGAGTIPTSNSINALDDVTAGDDMRANGDIAAGVSMAVGSTSLGSGGSGRILMVESSTPGGLATAVCALYFKSDGLLYYKNDSGTEYQVATV